MQIIIMLKLQRCSLSLSLPPLVKNGIFVDIFLSIKMRRTRFGGIIFFFRFSNCYVMMSCCCEFKTEIDAPWGFCLKQNIFLKGVS